MDLPATARLTVSRLDAAPPAAVLAELDPDRLGHAAARILATLLHRHASDPRIPALKAAAITAVATALHARTRAERRAGALLAEMEKAKGGNPNLSPPEDGLPTLATLGISRNESAPPAPAPPNRPRGPRRRP